MGREIGSNNTMPETINGKIYEVLSEAALEKATAYIRKYEIETDARLFRQGLIAIRNMLQYADKLAISKKSYEFSLIMDELKFHIRKVNVIILKVRGKRPQPQFSINDKIKVLEIEQALKSILGSDISLGNITPLLLEAFKEERGKIT